ncbi:MAG TPA: FAD-dependent oxidoreductase [Candidatus Acidoferrum sp.]|nr:FAD-dependent oxidoreductase [Candidatus Acidoferrum sp.]
MERMKKEILGCVQGEEPFCTALCPFALDMRDFMARLQRGRVDAAYRIYRDVVVFPGIVAALCPAPCKGACARVNFGGALQMDLVERSMVALAKAKKPSGYNMPGKSERVAVVGGGLSGLACALRLCQKKYAVTLYEKGPAPGGRALDLLPPELVKAELDLQFQSEDCAFEFMREIKSLAEIPADAYYIATGQNGPDFGLGAAESELILTDEARRTVLGGGLLGQGVTEAIVHGVRAAATIDSLLRTGKFEPIGPRNPTRLYVDTTGLEPVPPVVPAGELYTAEELAAEAARCLRCDCDACIRRCDLMTFYKKPPRRIVDEVDGTVNPGAIFSNRIATRLIASCEQCGMCAAACPMGVDMQRFLLESRREMVQKGDMPHVFSAFWLEDMAHAEGPAAFVGVPEGSATCTHLFFPGCQLGASDLRYVTKTYEALLKKLPHAGVMLGCCGVPAVWSGDRELQDRKMAALKAALKALGGPTVILACPTCKKTFTEYAPEVRTEFAYDYLEPVKTGGETFALFDPCASREEPALQARVRTLLKESGVLFEELKTAGGEAACCSYGGQLAIANPAMTKAVVGERTGLSPLPYVTYCTNCRDIFAKGAKPAVHLLDLLFGLNPTDRTPPTWTARRQNREELRRTMERRFGAEKTPPEIPSVKLMIPDEIKKALDADYTLENDIAAVVAHCEATGQKIENRADGTFSGHLRIGYRTHWVKYRPEGDGYLVLSAYSHRMNIKGDEAHGE